MTAAASPAAPGRLSVLAVIGFILGCVSVLGLIIVKTLVPVFDGPSFRDQIELFATVFGILNLLAIVPTALTIVFGHIGLAGSSKGARGRKLAVASIVLGYVLLALYLNRVVVALLAVLTFPHAAGFVQNNFYWG